ncbi:MAG: hypothetical protein AB7K37_14180 [Cyclobacteriaceae bacterium]
MISNIDNETLISVNKSYINILSLFLGEEKIDSRYMKCLLKWAIQLEMTPQDIKHSEDLELVQFVKPEARVEQAEALYHLVHMILLDKKIEDAELEVATIYAQKLGFKPQFVAELFKSIATAPDDGIKPRDVHKEVLDFIEMSENWVK